MVSFVVAFSLTVLVERSSKNSLRYEQLNEQLNLHTFSVILLFVWTGTQIRNNVWQYLYIQQVISQLPFAQFTSNFHHNSYFQEYFLGVVMMFGNSKKKFFVMSHFGTL